MTKAELTQKQVEQDGDILLNYFDEMAWFTLRMAQRVHALGSTVNHARIVSITSDSEKIETARFIVECNDWRERTFEFRHKEREVLLRTRKFKPKFTFKCLSDLT
jgi:hypothetical protein